jgi:membrane-bound lytic murein transglycosylase B
MSNSVRAFLISALLLAAFPLIASTALASSSGGAGAPSSYPAAHPSGWVDAVSGGVSATPPPHRPVATRTSSPVRSSTVSDIPSAYARWYRRAAAHYGLDWKVLAAIGHLESDHGRATARGVSSGINFARCCAGPMQMCIVRSCGHVWQYYAIDANRDGSASVYDPADAIYAAAALVHDLKLQVGRRASLLLAAYNAGPGAVAHFHGVPRYAETQAYVREGVRYIAGL